ncbi:MAG TPA: hypothetical protein VN281_14870 [Verrucomicrobiae bacterium]|jgi:hypothetical protein|nr:hypothetical protein [Verrucomicrobiae bacterium]
MKIVVNAKVRALLGELVEAHDKFDVQTEILSRRGDQALTNVAATEVGSDREHQRVVISGIAYRLANACAKRRPL